MSGLHRVNGGIKWYLAVFFWKFLVPGIALLTTPKPHEGHTTHPNECHPAVSQTKKKQQQSGKGDPWRMYPVPPLSPALTPAVASATALSLSASPSRLATDLASSRIRAASDSSRAISSAAALLSSASSSRALSAARRSRSTSPLATPAQRGRGGGAYSFVACLSH